MEEIDVNQANPFNEVSHCPAARPTPTRPPRGREQGASHATLPHKRHQHFSHTRAPDGHEKPTIPLYGGRAGHLLARDLRLHWRSPFQAAMVA